MSSLQEPAAAHIRKHFDEELRDLEIKIQAMGAAAQDLVELAMAGLLENKPVNFDKVIRGDDEVDFYYLEIERRVFAIFALQTPVATDLRFLTALLHVSLHLERVADMAVNIAKIGSLCAHLPRSQSVVTLPGRDGGHRAQDDQRSMDAFGRRDLELSLQLPSMDDPVDRLNRGMLRAILPFSEDRGCSSGGCRCTSYPVRSSALPITRWTSPSRPPF